MTSPFQTNSTARNRRALPDRDLLLAMKAQNNSFVLGTRKSQLALVQTGHVADALRELHSSSYSRNDDGNDDGVKVSSHDDCGQTPDIELPLAERNGGIFAHLVEKPYFPLQYSFSVEWMTTVGDRNQTTPLHLLSPYDSTQPAKSLWTDELEARLIHGHFDMLVHSFKDVPTILKDGCEIGCVVKREDPRDAFVVKKGLSYTRLEDLPDGSVVGTGSVRRVAQLKRAFPNLVFEDMRGNLNTRLAKLDNPESKFAALILAISGLTRIGLGDRVTTPLSSPTLMHAVGQGALAVEIRSNDLRTRNCLRGLGHWETEWSTAAERGCLRVLEGGCSVPVGVESELVELDPYGDHSDLTATVEDRYLPDDESPLLENSPMLWFSGLIDTVGTLPSTPTFFTSSLPRLRKRLARLSLHVCVTSTDGSKHVVHRPKPVFVRSYREAQRYGEECAREIRKMGAGEILDEINTLRKEREAEDIARAMEERRKMDLPQAQTQNDAAAEIVV
ncbi:porphobilinogen deaminase [Kwoniella shandongensis]|uniref:hydroxymethylbilane synthase n=1 Tax=Kwoniella shandongensis TaxID=1734106 RepID=A0A5M6BRF8_9TREE|nr:porphobilinogen deaminase [Kwoniella shandongensis]KAA5524530.1 porphobilinogen deaminase [Kwoniella shandongensis]